ncbi:MAG: SpoIIE family protein phosphatase [Deltaproteobacteria bacterium]|nr:SpoIIE family protein phosphatase [Deltaproteobacteria bacterium]
MFGSIKAKVLVSIGIVVISSAVFLMIFTSSGLKRDLLKSTEKSIRNILYLVRLNVKNQYNTLLLDKITTLRKRKSGLKNDAIIIQKGILNLYNKGLQEKELKQVIIEWLQELDKEKRGKYFFIFTEEGRLLYHPKQEWIGRDLADVKDTKGILLLQSIREKISDRGEAYETFSWPWNNSSTKILGYFTPIAIEKWILACAIPIQDIELETQRRLRVVISQLEKSMKDIKIVNNGFFLVLNSVGKIIIPPTLNDKESADLIASYLQKSKLVSKIREAKMENKDNEIFSLHFSMPINNQLEIMEVFISYFKALDWYIAACAPQSEIYMTVHKVVSRQVLVILITFILVLLIAYVLTHNIVKPINQLTKYARDLLKKDFSQHPPESSEIAMFSERYKDEVGRLAEAFVFLENSLYEYIQNLKETTAVKERIESELKIAHDIQMSILPKTFPPIPERSEIDLYATLKPAREVGGDFYDFFYIDKDNLFFVIGDVSGKGVPASLFMAITRTLIKASTESLSTPDKILQRVNKTLTEDNEACVFVTLFCGMLNIVTGELYYSNAGHNPPFTISPSENKISQLEVFPNMAAGVFPYVAYKLQQCTLKPGDALFLYTDGVTEATNLEEELFGTKRLQEVLTKGANFSPRDVCNLVLKEINTFSQGTPQADDITIMVLKFVGGTCPE